MCIKKGSDMGGRIRGLGTSDSWFSLVYGAMLLFGPGWRSIHACVPILVGFVLMLHRGFLFSEDVYDFSF
jgi:hypothetical protein